MKRFLSFWQGIRKSGVNKPFFLFRRFGLENIKNESRLKDIDASEIICCIGFKRKSFPLHSEISDSGRRNFRHIATIFTVTTRYGELNVMDDFLMTAAASDPEGREEFCRLLLSILLKCEIGQVKVNTQKDLAACSPSQHGVRLDVEVIEGFADLDYPDGLRYIFLTPEVRSRGLLDYLHDSRDENAKTEVLQTLHHHIQKVKILPEVKDSYMYFEEKIDYERKGARLNQAVDSILLLLGKYGEIPDELRRKIEAEESLGTLNKWFQLAVQCDSIRDFENQI